MKERTEKDSLGQVRVPANCYYGAQTKRSLDNFKISNQKMPLEIIHALAQIKKAASMANFDLQTLPKEKKELICKVCDEIIDGKHNEHFPLVVWQTGSGTQSNMNVNEVIANRAIEISKGVMGSKKPIHPNDDVNMSQSSNDTFPTAIHIALSLLIQNKLIPSLETFKETLEQKEKEFENIIKVGRTHLMDAVPVTVGQEFSGYKSQIGYAIKKLHESVQDLSFVPLGGSAVGTGLNTFQEYSKLVCKHLSTNINTPFHPAENTFAEMSGKERVLQVSSICKLIAVIFFKIANDIRLAASGPRAGINEYLLPANEPGSSIMPGKVNPTQCEALTMLAVQVMGNDSSVTIACSQGHFQLNTFMPLLAYNLIESIHLLGDGAINFVNKCLQDLICHVEKIDEHVENSLMLATVLNKEIGYDLASKIVKKAYEENISLKKAATDLKILSPEKFDAIVDPKKMIGPS